MPDLPAKLHAIDWPAVREAMHSRGYAVVPGIFPASECRQFIQQYHRPTGYRKTVVMEQYRYGQGEYRYFDYPLPAVVQAIRETVYPQLVPVANSWMQQLGIERQYPATLQEFLAECHAGQQLKPTPLILKYGPGGFNTLHQDLYGELYFPMQMAFLLNTPGEDFSGGEFVLTQQAPRAQSRAMVVPLQRGDMLVFTTNFRPVKSARGYYRAAMRHGVSEIHRGHRHTLGIIFHDAAS